MRLVILSGCGATGAHLIARCREAIEDVCVVRVDWQAPPARRSSLARRLSRLAPSRSMRRLHQVCLDWRDVRLERAISGELHDAPRPPDPHADQTVSAYSVRSPGFAERLRDLEADLMLVDGAPLLTPASFEAPRLGTINVHYGIPPRYRGTAALFWALYRRDFEHLGVTLHRMEATLDGGATLAQGFPALAPGDTEAVLLARCARLAASLFLQLWPALSAGPLPGVAQAEGGRAYRRRDLMPWHELTLAARHRLGLLQLPTLPERQLVSLGGSRGGAAPTLE